MRAYCRSVVAALVLLTAPLPALGWAARAHRLVTDLAVDIVPGHCAPLFKEHRRRLLNLCVEPDSVLRQREGHREAIRHYIDLDAYMPYPFDGFPRTYREAVRRFGRHAVEQRGVLPWVILRMERELQAAVRRQDEHATLQKAGYLSHYVADAFQPLHLTENYDGQKSGNDGVHLRFEVGVVDDRIDEYARALHGHLAPAQRIADLRATLFDDFNRTYPAIAKIMQADRDAREFLWPYGPLYYRRMDTALHAIAQRQLSEAATLLASIWYTACEDGQPPP